MTKILSWLLVLFITLTLSAQEEEPQFLTQTGQVVPSFQFTTIDGTRHRIEDFRGKYVLINFFATWCGPCMKELPEVETKIWKTLKKEDFVVIAVGREHTIDELKKFNAEKKFTFMISEDPSRGIYSKFAPSIIPRNYLLDKHGKIIYQKTGYSPAEFNELVLLIKNFLKKK